MKALIKSGVIVLLVLFSFGSSSFLYTIPASQINDEEIKAPEQGWKKGDWWIIRQKQQALWRGVKNPPWIDAGRLKFTVKDIKEIQGKKKYFVEVVNLDLPQHAKKKWELNLVYSDYFALVDGNYNIGTANFDIKNALKYIPLSTGGLNVNSLRLEKIKKIPTLGAELTQAHLDVRLKEERAFHRVDLEIADILKEKDVKEYQLWLPKEPWWRFYERSYGLPVKAEMVDCSYWHKESN